MKIGNKEIGENCSTYIIAEISINHMGNVDTAKKLIDVAAEAGADSIKFQKRHLPSLYSQEILDNPNKFEQGFQYIIPILKETELSEEAHIELKIHARTMGIEYLCTPFDIISAEFLSKINVKAYKIASCDLTNYEILEYIGWDRKPMILSTGMSSWAEITETVRRMKLAKLEFALLHCRSAYPVWPREVNLKMITKLKQFGVPVGYSGHDIGTTIPLVAASMGACIVEKHITLDRNQRGPDHKISLLPHELKILVRDIRIADQAMQDNERFLLRGEVLNRDVFRYKGKYPDRKEVLILKEPPGKWGMIARPNDLVKVMTFNPKVVEVRFTENDFQHGFVPQTYDAELVLHAPEYLGDRLFDLCSGNEQIRLESVRMAQGTISRAVFMKDYFKGIPKVVVHPGAMSMNTELRTDRLRNMLIRSVAQIDTRGLELLLENLPPYPWFFGGQWKGNFFMDADEIKEFCNETGYNICFDLSHAALYCNSTTWDISDYIKTVSAYIRHNHISDAYALDGEGVQIGDGDIDFGKAMPLLPDVTWVPEIWRGHLNGYAGFIKALNKIGGMYADINVFTE